MMKISLGVIIISAHVRIVICLASFIGSSKLEHIYIYEGSGHRTK